MSLSVFAILDSKFRATMQTPQAHNALVFDPFGLLILYFNGAYRALLRT